MHWEQRFRELAALQHGLVGRVNLYREPGLGNAHWWRARSNGRWEAISPHVLRLRGSAATNDQRALAAVLDASPCAFLVGESTLAFFGLRGFDLRAIQVARPYGTGMVTSRLGQVHRLRRIRVNDVLVARGVPTVSPLRAIWTVAQRYAPRHRFELGVARVGHLLDAAHRSNLVTWEALHESVEDLQQRGRAGTRLMRALAAERPVGSSPTESRNEQRFTEILAGAGISGYRRQVVVGGDQAIGRLDFRHAESPVAVEVNSLIHHTTPSDVARDQLRYQQLRELGLTVAVVWEDDLWSNPHSVLDTIRTASRLAAAGLADVVHSASCPWPDASHAGRRLSA